LIKTWNCISRAIIAGIIILAAGYFLFKNTGFWVESNGWVPIYLFAVGYYATWIFRLKTGACDSKKIRDIYN